ncbi:MAG: L-selenocysteinyl-tRNA(Sec) synthase [Burkholderiaceae bacterium]
MPDARDDVPRARPPSVDALLRSAAAATLIGRHGVSSVTTALRAAIDEAREGWRAVGRRSLIARMKNNPLKRCLRCDKATLATLEATLMLCREPEHLVERLTTLRWLTRARVQIAAVVAALLPSFSATLASIAPVTVEDCLSQIGTGAQPVELLPSAVLVIRPLQPKGAGRTLAAIEAAMRLPIPIVGRLRKGALWLDQRTVEDSTDLDDAWWHFTLKAEPSA